MKAQAEAVGLDWDAVKKGLARVLPIIKPIAKLTPNPFDDALVLFLESLLVARPAS